MKRLLMVVAVLGLTGTKCDKPRAPHDQALDAVEEAWWRAGEDLGTEPQQVTVVGEDDELIVTLTPDGDGATAVVAVEGERFSCRIDPDEEARCEP